MMFDNLIPYTDLHELNLDWIIKKIKDGEIKIEELEKFFYNDVEKQIKKYADEYIKENLSKFLLGAMYDNNDYSLKLQQVEVLTSSDHIYNNERILVMEGR